MNKQNIRIAFFGTPDFTVSFLDILKTSGYIPSLIVTNPDRPSGRGMTMHSPTPKIWGEAYSVQVLQPEKIDTVFMEEISQTAWDLFIVVAYGKILPEKLINMPMYGTINVHYSLLPKYRGASPVESAILNGDMTTGVTIQQMKYTLDAGDILAIKEISIDPTDTTVSLRDKLNTEALTLLPHTIKTILDGSIDPFIQDESEVTTCTKIHKEMGELDLSDDAYINDRKYRAYTGSIGTYFFHNGKRIKITKAHLENDTFIIDEIIPENGKRMPYKTLTTTNEIL